jgi:nucleoside-diphosphate-sugar epimerase
MLERIHRRAREGRDQMLVGVTGGTGFVGAHSVSAMVAEGHTVRLLVRDPARVERALAPLGVDLSAVDVVTADVRDAAAVAGGLRGVEAVLHAASVYSFDSRRRAELLSTNERGTEVVLAEARRLGADPIIHVSSFGALLPSPDGRPVGGHSPVGAPRETYLASKAAAEVAARRQQAQGVPVVITYPPALLGPYDPCLGDQTRRVRDALRGLMPMWPGGGFPVGDVRDTAALHAALLRGETSASRCFGPGRYLTTREYVQTLRAVTGRRLPSVFLPARAMLPVGRLADLAQRVWPWHIPAEYGAIYTCACATAVDEGADTLGVPARPAAQTMGDAVRWLREEGHLSAGQAGPLVRQAEPALVSD